MGEVVIGGTEDGRQEPPRIGAVVAVVAAVIVGGLVLVSNAGQEVIPEEPLNIAASTAATTTTSTLPLDLDDVVPVAAGVTTVEFSMAELLAGPRFTWTELVLPEALTSVFAVGELRGDLVVIGSTERPNVYGQVSGAVVYEMGDGGWGDPLPVFGSDRFTTAAEVGPRGLVVISSEAGGFRLAAEARIHSSIGGRSWSQTEIRRDGTDVLVRGIGSDDISSWVLVQFVTNTTGFVLEALPDEIQDLMDVPFTFLDITPDGRVSVTSIFDIELYETDLDELGVGFDLTYLDYGLFNTGLWVSRDGLTFNESPVPTDSLPNPDGIGGSFGRGVYLTGRSLLGSTDGSSWEVIEDSVSEQIVQVDGIDGTVIAQIGTSVALWSIDVLRGDERVRNNFQLGADRGHSGPAAVGAAGYLLPTGEVLERFAADVAPVIVETGGVTFTIDGGSATINVDGPDGMALVQIGPDAFGSFDVANRTVELIGGDGSILGEVPIGAIGQSIAPRLRVADQTNGLLFTPDGEQWGWSPSADFPGGSLGRVSVTGVGQTDVYVVSGTPQGLYGLGSTEPRLFVGQPMG